MPKDIFDYNQYSAYLSQSAAAQRAAAGKASDIARETADSNIGVLKQYNQQAQQVLQPFKQAGLSSLKDLQNLVSGKPITSNVTRTATLGDLQGLGVNVNAQQLAALGLTPGQAYQALTGGDEYGITAQDLNSMAQALRNDPNAGYVFRRDNQGNAIGLDESLLGRLQQAGEGQVTEQTSKDTIFSNPGAIYKQASQESVDALLERDRAITGYVLKDPLNQQLIDSAVRQGTEALEGSASASGSLRSGRTVEELFRLGQDTSLAFMGQDRNVLRNLGQQSFGMALQNYQNASNIQAQSLLGIGGLGAQAAGVQAQGLFGTAQGISGQNTYAGTAAANSALAVGNIQANLFQQLGQIDLQRQLDNYMFARPGGLGGAPDLSGGSAGYRPGGSSFAQTVPVQYGNPNFPGYNTPGGSFTSRSIF